MSNRSRRDLTLLGALVLAETLPFVNRAIHLDENTYLAIARHVSHNFWFPEDFASLWFGIPSLNFAPHTHPPGLPYFLDLMMQLFQGETVWLMRLGFLIFPLAYAFTGYLLACRFTRRPLAAAALMMATPAVLVFSSTLMPDLPMTTFWLLSALSFVCGLDEGKPWKVILTGVLLSLGTSVSYQAVFMSLLLLLYAVVTQKGGGIRKIPWFWILSSLGLPWMALTVFWCAGYLHYGFWPARVSIKYLATAHVFGVDYFQQKLLGMISTLGGTLLICFSIFLVFVKRERWKGLIVVLGLALAACAWMPQSYSAFERGEYIIFALGGLSLIGLVMRFLWSAIKGTFAGDRVSASHIFLGCWVLGVIVYTILLFEFSAARYIVAIAPAVSIIFVIEVERLFHRAEVRRTILGATFIVTWGLALAVAYADYQFVNSYRDFSKWFSHKYAPAQGTFWVGTEAGLRFYMELEGGRTLVNAFSPTNPECLPGVKWGEDHFGRPRSNDLLVRPESFLRYPLSSDLELSEMIDSRTLTSRLPIRTYGPLSHAGLHGTNVGLLPFAFSSAPLDRIEVYRCR
ncbi:MAG: glycosyltransferase family 39 protein [Acidobacteriia bacterium]|nr:glycosyltransferase family 39 protein [Terriglobia bacterium]